MYTFQTAFQENPSFSSTLLDKIYRSIDESDSNNQKDLKFYREEAAAMQRKQSKGGGRSRGKAEEEVSSFQRVSLVEKWMERKEIAERKELFEAIETKSRRDQDALFFSSTSSSSGSDSGSFSASETESTYGTISIRSCFAPLKSKTVRNNDTVKSGKPLKTLFHDFHHYSSASEKAPKFDENLIKSKSRAMKIYNNLKKVKQPLSPGGRLVSFINSLVSTRNTKKSNNFDSVVERQTDRKVKSELVSACSTASSFSRSCLSKNSPATRERLRNGAKRTVKFYPVSVTVDEDCRPCGQHNSRGKDEVPAKLVAVSVPSAWKIGKTPTEKTVANADSKVQVLGKSKRVEEMAREFLKEYHLNQKKISAVDYEDEADDDDAASCCSSDLFELDHLAVDRLRQELPVYETTRVDKNRAIAHGLIL